jgi:hypothetical protein
MRTLFPLALGLAAVVSSAASADLYFVPAPPTSAPVVFSRYLFDGPGGKVDRLETLYADGTFSIREHGETWLVTKTDPHVSGWFGLVLQGSGFLAMDGYDNSSRLGGVEVILQAYGGRVTAHYTRAKGVVVRPPIAEVEEAFDYVVGHAVSVWSESLSAQEDPN